MGVPPDPRRTARPRHSLVRELNRHDPQAKRASSSSSTRTDLEAVPPVPGLAGSGSGSERAPCGGSFAAPVGGLPLAAPVPPGAREGTGQGVLACDFFTVETVFLKTLYVLFFIELSTRRVHVAGTISRPDSAWVTQQARNLSITEALEDKRLLVGDRDAKFSGPFDEVFEPEGLTVVKTPVRAAQGQCRRGAMVGSVRRECLDHVLIFAKTSPAARPWCVRRALQPREAAPGPRPSTARSRIGL